jgi:protein-tyrosine phosphatase
MEHPITPPTELVQELRTVRRPKPPSLNSIALQMLGTIERDAHYLPEITDTIRKALEALPE